MSDSTQDDLVSIIVPVYNAQRHLSYCLDSILGQSHRNLDIILVDDGSTDDSARICDSYAERDTRVHVIHQPNGGIGAAQNSGLDASRGRFIAFADNDDILDRHNIAHLLHALLSTGADMSKARWSQFGLSQRDEVARLARRGATAPSGVTVFHDPLRAYQTVFCKSLRLLGQAAGRRTETRYFNEANWCRLYRREIWDGIRFPDGVYAQDVMVAGRLYERMNTVADIDVVLYHWLQSPESVTHAERSCDFYHDNVNAGIANFTLALGHGIIPMRSYYTMVGALAEERSSPDFTQNAATHEEDDSTVRSLVHRLSITERAMCSATRLIRLAEKAVYDRRVKNLR